MADGQAQKHLLFCMQKAAIAQINRRETGVLIQLDFPLGPALVCVLHWKNCVGSHERMSGSAHQHFNAPVIYIHGPRLRNGRG